MRFQAFCLRDEQVTSAFRRTPPMIGTSQVWCKKDRPFEERTALSLLLGLLRQLKEWGYKRSVRVSEHDKSQEAPKFAGYHLLIYFLKLKRRQRAKNIPKAPIVCMLNDGSLGVALNSHD